MFGCLDGCLDVWMDLVGFGWIWMFGCFVPFLFFIPKSPFLVVVGFLLSAGIFGVEVFYIGPEGRKRGKRNLRFCPAYQKFVDVLSETKNTSFFRHV